MNPRQIQRFLLFTACFASIAGCTGKGRFEHRRSTLPPCCTFLNEKLDLLLAPEVLECGDVFCDYFTAEQLRQLRENRRQVEPVLLERLRQGEHSAAYVLAYLGTTEALPILRKALLKERDFYGWEGPDYSKEQTYLADIQYPKQMAYITAIEVISRKPIWAAVKLTAAERQALENEARLAKPAPAYRKNYAAKWLLNKLSAPGRTSESTPYYLPVIGPISAP